MLCRGLLLTHFPHPRAVPLGQMYGPVYSIIFNFFKSTDRCSAGQVLPPFQSTRAENSPKDLTTPSKHSSSPSTQNVVITFVPMQNFDEAWVLLLGRFPLTLPSEDKRRPCFVFFFRFRDCFFALLFRIVVSTSGSSSLGESFSSLLLRAQRAFCCLVSFFLKISKAIRFLGTSSPPSCLTRDR